MPARRFMVIIASMAIVLLWAHVDHSRGDDRNFQINRQSSFMDYLGRRLVEHPYVLSDIFWPVITEEMVNELLDMAATRSNDTGDGGSILECTVCALTVGSISSLIANGTTDYWEVRNEVIDICEFVFNSTNVNTDLLCPGTCDNYFPHLFFILAAKPGTVEDVCLFQEYCPAGGFANRTSQEPATRTGGHRMTRERVEEGGRTEARAKAAKAKEQLTAAMDRDMVRRNSLRVFHFTDAHIDEKYVQGTATDCGMAICCREDLPGTGEAGYWGSFGCNVPPRTTELFFEELASMEQPVDLILYTGDNPPHATWEESLDGQMAASKWLASTMLKVLPDIDTYPCMGNHETFPGNLYWTKRGEIQQLNREFVSWWQSLTKWTEEQHRTIMDAGYYTMLARPGLRILAFNTNYGYNANWYNWLNVDEPEVYRMMQFMEDSMEMAANNNEKVILLGHHPSLGAPLRWSYFITDLMLRYHEILVLYVMGHTHLDEIHLIVDPLDGSAKSIEYVGGTSNSRSDYNPTGRIYYLDPVTFQVLDFDHFYLDIQENLENATLKFAYSATTEYGLTDLTPSSWYDLTLRMETDSTLLDKYRANQYGKSGQEAETCLDRCQQTILCNMRSSTWDERDSCLAAYP